MKRLAGGLPASLAAACSLFVPAAAMRFVGLARTLPKLYLPRDLRNRFGLVRDAQSIF